MTKLKGWRSQSMYVSFWPACASGLISVILVPPRTRSAETSGFRPFPPARRTTTSSPGSAGERRAEYIVYTRQFMGLVDKVQMKTKWRQIKTNFGGLVLGCINADFCVQLLILQHLSRSYEIFKIYKPLHRCNSKFTDFSIVFAKIRWIFEVFCKIQSILLKSLKICFFFRRDFHGFLP